MKLKNFIDGILHDWLIHHGLREEIVSWFKDIIVLVGLIVIGIALDYICRNIILVIIQRLAKKTKTIWDDKLVDRKFFHRIARLIPFAVVYYLIPIMFIDYPPILTHAVQTIIHISIIILVILAVNAFLNALIDVYSTFEIANRRPIKGYVQVVKIIVYLVGSIFIISALINKTPVYLLTGMGAMTAVLLFVFKDPILGFVAGIQISAYDMVRPGDWIQMPKYNADGKVIDIHLTTIKVQNGDKTITTIPTYALISESFMNWRGMEESGGRRIKRSINIDLNSVKFIHHTSVTSIPKYKAIRAYLEEKKNEIIAENADNALDVSEFMAESQQTNLGLFIAYLEIYLKQHPFIHNDMNVVARQLQPSGDGLPIEIYAFSKLQDWPKYETIQTEILDHIFAVIPEFELKVFQHPSGADFSKAFHE